MSKRRRMAQVMSDEAKIAAARKKIVALGLDEKEIMPKLLEKYGVLAYDFVNKAMLEPGRLCNRTGEKFLATKKLIKHYAEDEIEPALLAKAINKKPEEVKAKAVAYRAEQAHDEETKPVEIKKIERTAEMKSVLVDSVVDRRLPDLGIISIDKLMNLRNHNTSEFVESLSSTSAAEPTAEQDNVSLLRPEYNPNTPEGRAKKKAQERLAQLKEGKNGEISFADLKKNGVNKADMCTVMTQDRLGEVSSSQAMERMSKLSSKKGKSNCAQEVRKLCERKDTINFDYRNHMTGLPMTYYKVYDKNGRLIKTEKTMYTATTQIETMHRSDKFVCFDYDSDKVGLEELKGRITAKGAILGYPGSKSSIQPAGHTTVLRQNGNWQAGGVNSDEWLFGGSAAQRYAPKGETGTVSVIFDKDAKVSDQLAEDMLYQQYLREERQLEFMIARNNQSSRNS
ncbi:MAG: hypothetical protein J6A09_03455 [Alphaproteobacteria bacterium]|nr:hypothetical protein [Alphaproteobacteria bacterium]